MRALRNEQNRYHESLNKWLAENYPDAKRQISVTAIHSAPRQRLLFAAHQEDLVVDPLDEFFYTLFGQGVHYFLERYASHNEICEMRVGRKFMLNGKSYLVHGQADVYYKAEQILEDHKYTSTYAYSKENEAYVAQLNVLAYLFTKNGMPVKRIRNNYIFRDWSRLGVNKPGYPETKAKVKEYDLWPEEKVKEYIFSRLKIHRDASLENLPECSDEERWQQPSIYKAYRWMKKEKRYTKTASKTSASRAELEKMRDEDKENTYKIEEIASVPLKCAKFCIVGANGLCDQWEKYKKEIGYTDEQSSNIEE